MAELVIQQTAIKSSLFRQHLETGDAIPDSAYIERYIQEVFQTYANRIRTGIEAIREAQAVLGVDDDLYQKNLRRAANHLSQQRYRHVSTAGIQRGWRKISPRCYYVSSYERKYRLGYFVIGRSVIIAQGMQS
jgi:hypothetical protein